MLLPRGKGTLSYDYMYQMRVTLGAARAQVRGLPAYQGCRPASTENQLPKAIKHRMVFLAFRPLAENMPKGMFSGRCGPPARAVTIRKLNRRKSASCGHCSFRLISPPMRFPPQAVIGGSSLDP